MSATDIAMPQSLDSSQQQLVRDLIEAMRGVPGCRGAVLGGSHARGFARPDSDIDLGIYYSDASPLCISTIREISAGLPGSTDPVVSELFEWGPWVNGGAWLTIHGQRIDLIYRSLEHVERVVAGAEEGRYELHFGQQPPFGYFSPTYLGELSIAIVLFDRSARIENLKRRVTEYPERLRQQVVQDYLWSVEFTLRAFAPKFASRNEVYLTASTIGRCVHALLLVLFALNRRYLVNDKTALLEASQFALCPRDLRNRIETLLSSVGANAQELEDSVGRMSDLFREVVELCSSLYSPKYDASAGVA